MVRWCRGGEVAVRWWRSGSCEVVDEWSLGGGGG